MGFTFYQAIKKVVDAYDIPNDLDVNINEAPLPFVLLSKCTMVKKNGKLVQIPNSAHYRQVTRTFLIKPSVIFLPIQRIYQG